MNVQLFSVKDAAKVFGASPTWVYDRIARGELEVVDLGQGGERSKLRISARAIEAFVAARTVPARKSP